MPIRFADFGVLHRNELSGALNGLTRVRRFQQDDAHIFCRPDKSKQEVSSVLDFMRHVYGIFGMTFKLELSTRPKKAMGDLALWNKAEQNLKESLDEFIGVGNWKVNPGDGAFYVPRSILRFWMIFIVSTRRLQSNWISNCLFASICRTSLLMEQWSDL